MKGQSLERFSFNWSKVGDDNTQPPAHSCKPNILTFQSVREEDLDYYQCEVKEAGKVVLTVYRALYKDAHSKFSAGLYSVLLIHLIINTGECSGAAGQKRQLSAAESSSPKRTQLSLSPQGAFISACPNNNYV